MRKRTPPLLSLGLVLGLLMLSVPAAAALDMVMTIVGADGNTINGESGLASHPDGIDVLAFSYGVHVPLGTDGTPSGPAITQPLSITGYFESSTARLMQAQSSGETLQSLTLEVIIPGAAKMAMVMSRYELTDVHVASISGGGSGGEDRLTHNMSFSYSQITITEVASGTIATYNWNASPSAAPEEAAKSILLTTTPNPAHDRTEFRFSLPSDSDARLTLYDIRGRVVRELHSGWTSNKAMAVVWDGTDDRGNAVAQGVYLARLTYPGHEVTQRITLLR